MKHRARTLAAALLDPSTRTGTAWWACLAVTIYDAARAGVTLTNGAVLLALAGLDLVARAILTGRTPPECPA